jgi:general secretion pathway protein D
MPRISALLAAAAILGVAAPRTRADVEHPAHAAPAADPPIDEEKLFACTKADAHFAVNLKPDVELKDLVTWAMGFTCKRFLYGSALAARTAKVTMVTPGAMSARDAWGMFEIALHSMGLTAVDKGAVIEILESPTVKDEALRIAHTFPDGGADVVRVLLRPEHVDVADLAAALELVRSKNGVVSPLPKLRALLVTDDADHVARMRPLVDALDRPAAGDSIYAIPLRHVDATSLLATINKMIDTGSPAVGAGAGTGGAPSGAAGGPRVRIVADARTNALFIAGTVADYARVHAIANAIDVDTGTDNGVHLIRLKHAHAKDLATTLNAVLTGSTAGGAAGTGTAGARTVPPADQSGASGFSPSGAVRITADEASNSLLVMASAHDASSLRALVEDMDAPVQQVYLEALVLEVEANNDETLGVSWHDMSSGSDGSVSFAGSLGSNLSSVVPATAASSIGFIAGSLGALLPTKDLLGQTIPSYGYLLAAGVQSKRVDVLASPHLLTIDNHLAKISVGENVPYHTSSGGTTVGGTVLGSTVARQPLALTLSITPHVAPAPPEMASADREVALDIDLEDSEMPTASTSSSVDLDPVWKDRSLVTSVVLHDEETLVLGGLVDERTSETEDKIPILGDIPILGHLFKQTTKSRQKSNLLVLITPHVISDSAEGRDILARRMRERDEFVNAASDLEKRVWAPEMRPEKMRGLVADIDANVRQIERERAELDAAARPHGVTPGRIDPPADAPEPAADAPASAPPPP